MQRFAKIIELKDVDKQVLFYAEYVPEEDVTKVHQVIEFNSIFSDAALIIEGDKQEESSLSFIEKADEKTARQLYDFVADFHKKNFTQEEYGGDDDR